MRRQPYVVASIVVSLVAIACGASEDDGSVLLGSELDAESTLFKMSLGGEGCPVEVPALPDTFLAALPDCGNGQGKCIPPSSMMKQSMTKELAPCDGGGSCVPLMFLKLKSEPLRTCTSYQKAEGVCISRVIPRLEKLTFLPQDACNPEERCVPCANPVDGKKTGICELGKPAKKSGESCNSEEESVKPECPHKGPPVLDVSKLASCGTGMHCLPGAIVPKDFSAMLAPCPDGQSFCAPDKSIEANGQFIPKTCSSVGGAEGRCLNASIPQVTAQGKFLPSEGCDTGEKCVPCYDPISGEKLPTCNISCDPGPTKPAVIFGKCADGRGRCVPKSAVPAGMDKNLKQFECKGEELCAPNLAIEKNPKPQMCEFKLLGFATSNAAVCVEDVLKMGFILSQSNCTDGFKCAPCVNPLNKTPTGLPGCPQ
jgi:hypothetical protein